MERMHLKHKRPRAWVVGACLLVTLPAFALTPPAPLRLSTHELPPYSSKATGKPSGIAVEVVSCAAQRLGIQLELDFQPWARAQYHAQHGETDGFFAASRSESRDSYATLSVTIAPQEWRWYILRNSRLQPGDPEFKEKARVSSFLGANMQDWLEEQGFAAQVPPLQSELLLEMLFQKRLDAILANHLVMGRLLAKHPRAPDVRSALAKDKPLGVYVTNRFLSQQREGFMDRFNAALGQCTVSR